MKKRLLSLLLVFVMVLGMLPVSAFAAETESGPVEVTISGMHSAQVSAAKLYTYSDGVKGETDLLEGVETTADGYSYLYNTTLVPGDYWVEGYDANGYLNGGIKITVTADGENVFKVQRMYQIYASNSGWVEGTDYTISVEVTNGTTVREVELGTALYSGNVRTSCLFLLGDTVKANFTPIGEKAELAMETSVSKTPTANDYISASIPESLLMTFVVPEGSTVDVGKLTKTYFVYDFYSAESGPVAGEAEGTEVWTFKVPKETVNASSGPYLFYRVSNDEGVTYWDFFDPKSVTETTVTLTAEDLFIGSEEFNKNSIITDYSQNLHDTANIYLNINNQGYESMDVGEVFEINAFRNWQAIEHFYNRRIALPDVNYEIVNLEGDKVISIEPDAHNSGLAYMTAEGTGTAIVLVTYDAMFSNQAMTDYDNSVYYQPCLFSAIWPEFTGVFVVTVGKDGTGIDMGMTIDRAGTESIIDAEHDFLYYVGDEGASYTFNPESGCTVTVSRGQVSETEMTFGDFTDEGVTVNEDGSVTVAGLTTGRHIIKVEKDGVANYQVLTARQTSYELQKEVTVTAEDGTVSTTYEAMTEEEIAQIKANDTVYIQFANLVNPVEKLSGVYNFNARLRYEGEEGTVFASNPGGSYGVYDFSSDPERQFIAITIPKYWTGDSYTMTGLIAMAGNGDAATAHRGVRYGVGIAFNPASPSASMNVSQLPEITIPVAETNFLTGELSFVDQNGDPVTADLTITMTDAEGNGVVVNEDGTFGCLAGEYSYVINGRGVQYTTGTVTVTEDGENQFTITLQTTSENAWDGVTLTEPATDENGVYLIGTGAELAWFSAQNQNKVSATGKLTADIDLGCYPWNNTNTSTGSYVTILDGDGYEIYNFNSTKALFGTICGASAIRNLTIRGEVNGTGSNGALVGYAYGTGGVIENCVSYVTVNSTGSNVGGLVGYAAAAEIRNCVNHGDVSGTSSVGGIIGGFVGTTKVSGCYNTGSVTGSSDRVGGVFGGSGYNITVTGCYNTGDVSGANYVGGVGGQLASSYYGTDYATAADCYNVGAVSGTGSNVGGAVGGVAYRVSGERIYYLEGTAESDVAATVLTEEEMKSADLDTTIYGGTCDGYPALLWQTDVTFHTDSDPVETAPNCTEKGYTEYTCSECGVSYRKDYVDALGHDWCDDTQGCDDCVYTAPTCTEAGSIVRTCRFDGCEQGKNEVIPATGHTADEAQTVEGMLYNDCVCAVCGESYRVWHDERFQYMTLPGSGLESITSEDNAYPWNYNAETGRFESSNKGFNSTTSQTAFTITLSKTATISFNYGVSSETNYDKLTISALIGDQTLTIANAISGTQESAFSYELPAGTYTLTFAYSKDSSSASGSDIGWFSDLKIEVAEPEISYGDVNGDGTVDVTDANLVVSHYYSNTQISEELLPVADVNGDGTIDVQDANLIVSYYYGAIEDLPGEG